jgi:predicted SAM-dependent methyltransferase
MAEICSSNLSGLSNVRVNCGDLVQILNSKTNRGSTDLIIANFHVFSYFTDNEVAQFAEVCHVFLKSGGLVSFDFWDLEAVIASPPVETVKSAQYFDQEITRVTKPEIRNNSREIAVNFEFYEFSEFLFKETHYMFPRYLHEVKSYFQESFEFCGSYDLYSGQTYSQKAYGNLVFFRKF